MEKRIIYHGSISVIEKPIFGAGKPYNDYGLGFYCTESLELAKEWACVDNQTNGFANKYELDLTGLKVLNLSDEKYSILNWMAILVKFRSFDTTAEVSRRAKEFLIKNYYIDVAQYDVVIGYRADDSYFRFAKDFLNNTISVQKLAKAMQLGELGLQIVLISEKAFNSIHFISSEPVDHQIYYTKRFARDRSAREAYTSSSTASFENEEFISDIMRRGHNDAN